MDNVSNLTSQAEDTVLMLCQVCQMGSQNELKEPGEGAEIFNFILWDLMALTSAQDHSLPVH